MFAPEEEGLPLPVYNNPNPALPAYLPPSHTGILDICMLDSTLSGRNQLTSARLKTVPALVNYVHQIRKADQVSRMVRGSSGAVLGPPGGRWGEIGEKDFVLKKRIFK